MPRNMKLRLLNRWFHNVKADSAKSTENLKIIFSNYNLYIAKNFERRKVTSFSFY